MQLLVGVHLSLKLVVMVTQGKGEIILWKGGGAIEIWDVRRGWITKSAIGNITSEGGIAGLFSLLCALIIFVRFWLKHRRHNGSPSRPESGHPTRIRIYCTVPLSHYHLIHQLPCPSIALDRRGSTAGLSLRNSSHSGLRHVCLSGYESPSYYTHPSVPYRWPSAVDRGWSWWRQGWIIITFPRVSPKVLNNISPLSLYSLFRHPFYSSIVILAYLMTEIIYACYLLLVYSRRKQFRNWLYHRGADMFCNDGVRSKTEPTSSLREYQCWAKYVNRNYTCGKKVVQWTVSNAPGGSSLRDVSAIAKVKTRAKI